MARSSPGAVVGLLAEGAGSLSAPRREGMLRDPLSAAAPTPTLRGLADPLVQRTRGSSALRESAEARKERRKKGYKPGLDVESLRREREDQALQIRKEKRLENTSRRRGLTGRSPPPGMETVEQDPPTQSLWQPPPTPVDEELEQLQIRGDDSTPMDHHLVAAKRIAVEQDVKSLLGQAKDTVELEFGLSMIMLQRELQDIKLVGLEQGAPRIWFKINPEYEIPLAPISGIAMRASGSKGGKFETRAEWTEQTLSLGGQSFTVGHSMTANPLSQDSATGSEAKADSDHDGLMNIMPTLGSHPGDKRNQYIKGHLLNDNLGGIAVGKNLYPITGYANGKHLQFVESYIKSAIDLGYVMAYRVVVNEKSKGTTPFNGGQLYTVDADMEFEFARLDTSLKPLAGTIHKNHIESRFGLDGTAPYDQKTEFKTDYTDGKASKPKSVTGESTHKTKRKSKVTTNSQVDIDHPTAWTLSAPDSSLFTLGIGGTPPPTTQSVDPTYTAPSSKLVLSSATDQAKLEAEYGKLVKHWAVGDIQAWLLAVQSKPKLNRWAVVEDEAVNTGKLDAKIAAEIFQAGGLGRSIATLV